MDFNALHSSEIIDLMIDLRSQIADLERQVDVLKPAFFAACNEFDTLRFQHERAIISRRLTLGQWNYPSYILESERQLKRIKLEFQQTHEPVGGREVTWSVKLLTD
jgi:hypothetical protein